RTKRKPSVWCLLPPPTLGSRPSSSSGHTTSPNLQSIQRGRFPPCNRLCHSQCFQHSTIFTRVSLVGRNALQLRRLRSRDFYARLGYQKVSRTHKRNYKPL